MDMENENCVQEFEISCLSAIQLIYEAAYDCEIRSREVMLSNLKHGITLESAQILCEDSDRNFEEASDSALKKFFDAVSTFIKNIAKKISQHIAEKKTEVKLKGLQDALRDNPDLANEKIEVFDLNALSRAQQKHLNQVQKILAKQNSGKMLTAKERDELVHFANDDYAKISATKVIIPVSVALTALGGTIAFCKASGKSLGDLASDVKSSINRCFNSSKDVNAKERADALRSQLKDAQTAISRLGQDRVTALKPIESNLSLLEALIERMQNRDARMNKRAESKNLIIRATGVVGRARQRSKDKAGFLGIGPMPSRHVQVETYTKQQERQRKIYDNTAKKYDKQIAAKQREANRIQAKLDNLESK